MSEYEYGGIVPAPLAAKAATGPDIELPSLSEVARAAGVTYRQADHWVAKGYVQPLVYRGTERSDVCGTGLRRHLPIPEARVLHLIARMVKAGIAARVAGPAARDVVYKKREAISLGGGLHLLISEQPTDP